MDKLQQYLFLCSLNTVDCGTMARASTSNNASNNSNKLALFEICLTQIIDIFAN